MDPELWRRRVAAQAGIVRRDQLAGMGLTWDFVQAQLDAERWQVVTPTVIATVNGALTPEQATWAAVQNGGASAMLGGIAAAEVAGLRNWHRDRMQVFVPYGSRPPRLDGVDYVTTRRRLSSMRASGSDLARMRIEPAVLLWAAAQRSERSALGVVAASVQQRLTTPSAFQEWVERLAPLRRAEGLRRALEEIAGGAHSVAEMDIRRMCRRFGIQPPQRQVKRRDASGRMRFTDAEWRLPDGRIIVLEVDGGFHMEVEHWADDLTRQRALTSPLVSIIRCSAQEAREGDAVARDLIRLGVPRAA